MASMDYENENGTRYEGKHYTIYQAQGHLIVCQ
jgi:hypothetical protein